jgi:hypothetical protein
MRYFVNTFDATDCRSNQNIGGDFTGVVPRTIRTERGAVAWARRWLARPRLPEHAARIRSAALDVFSGDEAIYGLPDAIVELRLSAPSRAEE